MSPVMNRHSPRRRSSPRRERSPAHCLISPRRRSPQRTSSSHRVRSPAKEKLTDQAKSPKHSRPRSPVRTNSSLSPSHHTKHLKRAQTEREGEKMTDRERGRNAGRDKHDKGRQREHEEKERTSSSHSPSPHTKRLMRAKAERGAEKIVERDHGKDTRREERNKGRHGEHEDVPSESRSVRDKKGTDSYRSRRDRPVSPEEHNNHWSKHGSRSPPRGSRAGSRDEATKPRDAEEFGDDLDSIARMKAAEESLEAKDKDKVKPSFELSGKLAEETNRFRGVTLLFNEPADARKPDIRWRLYVFKAGEVLNEPLYVHRQSCYLFGRERRVADIPTDHPSCSKQHAVIQYRLVEKEKPDGLMAKQPRICDTARELCWMNALACKAKFSHRQLQDHLRAYRVCSSMLLLLLFLTHQHPLNLTREQLLKRDNLVYWHTFLSDFVSSQSSFVTGSNMTCFMYNSADTQC